MLPALPLFDELLDKPLVASLATFNPDGSVHVVAIWFLRDGHDLLMGTNAGSRKARNLARDERATVMVHDSRGGFDVCGVTLVGAATIVPPPESLELNHRVHLKYVTERGLATASVAEFLAGDDVTIRFETARWSFWDERYTAAARALRASSETHVWPPGA